MTPANALQAIRYLVAAFPNRIDLTDDVVAVWADLLSDAPDVQTIQAVRALCAQADRVHPPTIGEVRAAVYDLLGGDGWPPLDVAVQQAKAYWRRREQAAYGMTPHDDLVIHDEVRRIAFAVEGNLTAFRLEYRDARAARRRTEAVDLAAVARRELTA